MGSAKRLLIVDDYVDAADMTAAALRMNGFAVRVAYSGADAILAAREFSPEVIFLDLGMPIMDGWDVAEALKSDKAFRGTTLVALTAWDDEASMGRTRAAGFDAHVAKPSRIEQLIELVQPPEPRLARREWSDRSAVEILRQ